MQQRTDAKPPKIELVLYSAGLSSRARNKEPTDHSPPSLVSSPLQANGTPTNHRSPKKRTCTLLDFYGVSRGGMHLYYLILCKIPIATPSKPRSYHLATLRLGYRYPLIYPIDAPSRGYLRQPTKKPLGASSLLSLSLAQQFSHFIVVSVLGYCSKHFKYG